MWTLITRLAMLKKAYDWYKNYQAKKAAKEAKKNRNKRASQ